MVDILFSEPKSLGMQRESNGVNFDMIQFSVVNTSSVCSQLLSVDLF